MLRPYNDPDYRAAAAWLKHHPGTPCTLRLPGTRPAIVPP